MKNLQPALHDHRTKLARKIVDYAKNGKTDWAPGVMQIDTSVYLDPTLFAREHAKLFRGMPLVACLSTDLAEPGSYRIFDDTGIPIVVTRDKAGKVHAFLNVCAHRGGRVVRDECGKASRFTCRYHGWTYDASGQAIGVPTEEQFCGEIDDQKKLLPCPAEERYGLVFVQATPNSTMDLDAHIGDFAHELEVLDLGSVIQAKNDQVSIPSNWKYTLDTYFENYHLPSLHRDTFANVFASNLCTFDTWGPHHRYVFPQRTIYDWMDKPESEWLINAMSFTLFLFPNTVISVGSVTKSGSLVSVHRMFPHAVDSLTTKIALYVPGGANTPEAKAEVDVSFTSIMAAVNDEDYSVTGESYLSLSALPEGTKFPLGRQEIGVQNLHHNIERLTMA